MIFLSSKKKTFCDYNTSCLFKAGILSTLETELFFEKKSGVVFRINIENDWLSADSASPQLSVAFKISTIGSQKVERLLCCSHKKTLRYVPKSIHPFTHQAQFKSLSNVLRDPALIPHCRLKMDQVEVSWLSRCEESLIYCRILGRNITWTFCIFSLLHGVQLIFKFIWHCFCESGTRSHCYSKCKWDDFWGLEAPNRSSNRCVTS